MTPLSVALMIMATLGGSESSGTVNPGCGQPLKYISSCEIDLNADGHADVAMLVETVRGLELIVLMKSTDGYDTHVVSNDKTGMYLACHYGSTIAESPSGNNKSDTVKTFRTPGAYLELYLPESSAVAYFWNGSGFTEVWTAD